MTPKPTATRQGWALALLPFSMACADAMAVVDDDNGLIVHIDQRLGLDR